MKTVISPTEISPKSTMRPPRVSTSATPMAVRKPMIGMYTAFSQTAWIVVRRMSSVTVRKAVSFFSSITSVLEVFAPEMPSL